MAEVTKVTERDYYEDIKVIAEGADRQDIVDFADKKIGQLIAKAEKAKARAAKAREKGDELRSAIFAVLTAEPQTIDEITAAVDFDEVTRGKVVPRLGQLAEQGAAVKEMIKVDGSSRKVVAYKLAPEIAEDEADAE